MAIPNGDDEMKLYDKDGWIVLYRKDSRSIDIHFGHSLIAWLWIDPDMTDIFKSLRYQREQGHKKVIPQEVKDLVFLIKGMLI